MPAGGVRGQNLGHLKKCFFQVLFWNHLMLIPDKQLIRKHSYLITWYHAVLALTPLRLQTCGCMPGVGSWGQNLEHLRIFFPFTFFSCMELFIFESFVFEQKALYRADFLSVTLNYRVQCAWVGPGFKI